MILMKNNKVLIRDVTLRPEPFILEVCFLRHDFLNVTCYHGVSGPVTRHVQCPIYLIGHNLVGHNMGARGPCAHNYVRPNNV